MRFFRLRKAFLERLYTMTRSKFAEQQIAFALQQVETRTSIKEVCRMTGMSEATFCSWKKVHGGRMPSEVRRLRQFEGENARLRRRVADLSLGKEMPMEVIRKEL